MGVVAERFYFIDAELTFARPVSADRQDDAEFAISEIATPTLVKPSIRWLTSRRARVDQLGVSASTSGHAIAAARDSLRECMQECTTLPLQSFAALKVKLGTRN